MARRDLRARQLPTWEQIESNQKRKKIRAAAWIALSGTITTLIGLGLLLYETVPDWTKAHQAAFFALLYGGVAAMVSLQQIFYSTKKKDT